MSLNITSNVHDIQRQGKTVQGDPVIQYMSVSSRVMENTSCIKLLYKNRLKIMLGGAKLGRS